MAITHNPPNTIYLGGPRVQVNTVAANEAITPGMLIERYTSSGKTRWKKAATAKGPGTIFATDQAMVNKGVDDAYAANDLVEASIGAPGSSFWAIIASGATIAFGDKLENAGNGKLRAWTDASQAFVALEAVTAVADSRIRVEVL